MARSAFTANVVYHPNVSHPQISAESINRNSNGMNNTVLPVKAENGAKRDGWNMLLRAVAQVYEQEKSLIPKSKPRGKAKKFTITASGNRPVPPHPNDTHLCPFCLMGLHEHSGSNNFVCDTIRKRRDGWLYELAPDVRLYKVKVPGDEELKFRAYPDYIRGVSGIREYVYFIREPQQREWEQKWLSDGYVATLLPFKSVTINSCRYIRKKFNASGWNVKETAFFYNFYAEHEKKGWYLSELCKSNEEEDRRCGYCATHAQEIEEDTHRSKTVRKKHLLSLQRLGVAGTQAKPKKRRKRMKSPSSNGGGVRVTNTMAMTTMSSNMHPSMAPTSSVNPTGGTVVMGLQQHAVTQHNPGVIPANAATNRSGGNAMVNMMPTSSSLPQQGAAAVMSTSFQNGNGVIAPPPFRQLKSMFYPFTPPSPSPSPSS